MEPGTWDYLDSTSGVAMKLDLILFFFFFFNPNRRTVHSQLSISIFNVKSLL